jgi:hypothetical protein
MKIAGQIARLSAELEEGWQNQLVMREEYDETTGEPYLGVERHYLNHDLRSGTTL